MRIENHVLTAVLDTPVNLSFVAFSRLHGIDGQIFVFFAMTVAAAEAAVGLAIIISIFRHYETVDVQSFNLLKW